MTSHPPKLERRDSITALLLILAFACFYGLLTPYTVANWPLTGDEPHYLAMAESIYRDHDLDLSNNAPECAQDPHGHIIDGKLRPAHMLGLPLLISLPFGLFGRTGAAYALALVSALTVGLTYPLCRRLSCRGGAALTGAIVLGSLPPFSVYATMLYPEVPGALLVTLALVLAGTERARPWHRSALGLALAALPWLVIRFAPLSLAIAAVVIWQLRHDKHLVRDTALILAPCVLSAALYLAYNQYVYGHWSPLALYGAQPAATGVSWLAKWAAGLYGWFFDQRVGLLAVAPMYLVSLVGLVWLAKTERHVSAPLLVTFAVGIITSVVVPGFWVQWSPATRYLVVMLPILAVGVGMVTDASRSHLVRAYLILATVASAVLGGMLYARPWLAYNYSFGTSNLLGSLPPAAGLDITRVLPLMDSSKTYKDTRVTPATDPLIPGSRVYVPGVETAHVSGGETMGDPDATYGLATRFGAGDGNPRWLAAPTYVPASPGEYLFVARVRRMTPELEEGTRSGILRLAVLPDVADPGGPALAETSVLAEDLGPDYAEIRLTYKNTEPSVLFFMVDCSEISGIAVDYIKVKHYGQPSAWVRYGWLGLAIIVLALTFFGLRKPDVTPDPWQARFVLALVMVCLATIIGLLLLAGAPPGRQARRHHAEMLRRQVGRVSFDLQAANWLAVVSHESGFMGYGPYVCIRPGVYTADFRVRAGEGPIPEGNDVAAIIEVTAGGGSNVLASSSLSASALTNEYRSYSVPFVLDTNAALEVRVITTALVEVWLDEIIVRPSQSTGDH